MIGVVRTIRDGNAAYEMIVLREQGDRLAYEAHRSGQSQRLSFDAHQPVGAGVRETGARLSAGGGIASTETRCGRGFAVRRTEKSRIEFPYTRARVRRPVSAPHRRSTS